jgi:hypothetical protein
MKWRNTMTEYEILKSRVLTEFNLNYVNTKGLLKFNNEETSTEMYGYPVVEIIGLPMLFQTTEESGDLTIVTGYGLSEEYHKGSVEYNVLTHTIKFFVESIV